ncbi:hypothetical protein LOC67_16975 [Stieleria sp. JC731]|nr:hypothetical protein [Stieleria sp. JC731]MCC9602251.1 hypothetical protein [Stieleria sp. JC731]
MTLLASVSSDEIASIRADVKAVLKPAKKSCVSHYFVSGPRPNDAANLVAEVLDGGFILNEAFWHPLRPPMFRDVNATQTLFQSLTSDQYALDFDVLRADDWFRSELDRLFAIVAHASTNGLCLVSAIEPPADKERAVHVRVPWEQHSKTHGQPSVRSFWQRILGG